MERNEINDVAPTSLSHIIGQKSVVAQVAVALEAAFADNKKFDSALMVGPPGVGKSALAHVIADEMAAQLLEVLGQSIDSPADLNSLLLTSTSMRRTNWTRPIRRASIWRWIRVASRSRAAEVDEARRVFPWPISRSCSPQPTNMPSSSRSGTA